MIKTQVFEMLEMNDTSLKRYLEKECKHKEEIQNWISNARIEASQNNDTALFDRLSWLHDVVKGTVVLCPE